MNRGISFLVKNDYTHVLYDILELASENYYWLICTDEVLVSEGEKIVSQSLFKSVELDGHTFLNLIKSKTYLPILLDLKAFNRISDIKNIKDYEEYEKSGCQLILLIVDSSYVDLYVKDEKLLSYLYKNALQKNFKNVEYINEKDSRTRMAVI